MLISHIKLQTTSLHVILYSFWCHAARYNLFVPDNFCMLNEDINWDRMQSCGKLMITQLAWNERRSIYIRWKKKDIRTFLLNFMSKQTNRRKIHHCSWHFLTRSKKAFTHPNRHFCGPISVCRQKIDAHFSALTVVERSTFIWCLIKLFRDAIRARARKEG